MRLTTYKTHNFCCKCGERDGWYPKSELRCPEHGIMLRRKNRHQAVKMEAQA